MTKTKIPFLRGIGVGILVLILSFSSAYGLLFLQDQTDITESYTAEQTTVITLLNDQPRSQNVFIQIAPTSQYLLSYIDIEDSTITLVPGEKKNILINTLLPEDTLSPETHSIDIIARSDDDKSVARTKILFTVPGIARPNLELASQEFNIDGAEKILSFELENAGNVIMRPQPEIIITQNNVEVKSIEYKTPIQIMPSRTYPLSMRMDVGTLEEGNYEVQVIFTDRDDIKLESKKESFEVKSTYESTVQVQNIIMPLIIGGIFIVLVSALFIVNRILKKRQDPLDQKIRSLEKKEKAMEKELQKLINETHRTVGTANQWIKKHLGEEYELR